MLSSIQPNEAASRARFCSAEALVSQLNAPPKKAPSAPEYSGYCGTDIGDSRDPVRRAQLKDNVATAGDIRIAGEPGALLDKGFVAQDLPRFLPKAEMASESSSKAI
jgi:hypothetical protein